MATPQVQGIQPGSLSSQALHALGKKELRKIYEILSKNQELATTPINKLPISKDQKTALKVGIGSELNVYGKQSQLVETSKALARATKAAGKALSKNEKVIYSAKENILKIIGEVEIVLAQGESIDRAFSKSKRADQFI